MKEKKKKHLNYTNISKLISIVIIILAVIYLKQHNSINKNILTYYIILVNYFNIVIERKGK